MNDAAPLPADGPALARAEAGAPVPPPSAWVAALGVHAALIAVAVLLSQHAPAPSAVAPPPALDVAIVEFPPAPAPARRAEAAEAPETDAADATTSESTPSFAFAPRLAAPATPAIASVLARRDAAVAPERESVPEPVRRVIDGYRRCASTASTDDARSANCDGAVQRFAHLGGGAAGAGLAPGDFLDASVLEPAELPRAVRLLGTAIKTAFFGADASMFDGRAGERATPVAPWVANYRSDARLVDERYFDLTGRDIEVPEVTRP
jgi:hypothetical protein